MKRGLKILYKIPDTERLAQKYKDFDELMDQYALQKHNRRKRLVKNTVVLSAVALISSLLTWLIVFEKGQQADSDILPIETEIQSPVIADSIIDRVAIEEEEILEQEPSDSIPVEEQVLPKVIREEKVPSPKAEGILAEPALIEEGLLSKDAEPNGGVAALYQYFMRELIIPDSLFTSDELEFEISFQVLVDGSVNEIDFNHDFPLAFDDYLKKVVESMPKWKPAIDKGDTVNSQIVLPFTFTKQ